MNRALRFSLSFGAVVLLAACAETPVTAVELPLEAAGTRAPAKTESSIGQIAVEAATNPNPAERQFTQLVAALQYVDEKEGTSLVNLFVAGRDQYTVFAPTDAAFSRLYALAGALLGGPVSGIRDLPSSIVRDVLLYHVTEGRRAANSVVPRNGVRTVSTLKGESFAVTPSLTIRDGLTPVDPDPRPDAAIVKANLPASNGIVHVIDQVLLPPSVVSTLLSLAAGR